LKLALVSVDNIENLPPLGLGYLASYLKKYANFENTVIVDKENQVERVRKEKPDLVGISATTVDFAKAWDIAKKVKQEMDVPILLGGFHLSAQPNIMPKEFDIGILGEGEDVLIDLIDNFEKKGSFEAKDVVKIKSLVYRDGNKLKQTERRSNIQPLDKIPFPDRKLFKMKEWYLKPARHTFDKLSIGTSIITTRGCIYNCVFCSQTGFWRGSMRFFSPEYVVEEMKEITDNYKIDMLRIMDDLFAVNRKRVAKIAELMKKEGITDKVELHVFGRTNLVNEEMCKYLKQMNVNYINFGLESGSERILNYLKNGSVTVDQHRNALALCAKNDLKVDASFIFGAPGETEADIKKTFELMRNPAIKSSMVFQLTPFPSSAIWDYAIKKGLVKDDMDWDRMKAYVGNPDLPWMNEAMDREFFNEKMAPLIREEYKKCNYRHGQLKIKWQYMLNPLLIKRFLSNWKGFSREFVFRLQQKYGKKEKVPETGFEETAKN